MTLLLGARSAEAQLPPAEPAPEMARIVFEADSALFTIGADGSGRTRVTQGALVSDSDPAWSPAGDLIAFNRSSEEDQPRGVWLSRPDGSEARPLIASPRPDRFDSGAAWSPDASRIAFVRFREGKDRFSISIVTAALDGGDQRTVYSESAGFEDDADIAFFYSLAWSPDGQQILFTRSGEGLVGALDLHPSLNVVPAAGGTPRRLATDARDGTWSPDGARIAFAAVDTGRACEGDCEFTGDIAVMNADGSGRAALMHTKADDAEPSWAGDGERIVFQSDRNSLGAEFADEPQPELYSVKPDGSCLTWLTNGTALSGSPSFDPRRSLSSEPGACGPTPREPLVETDTRAAESFRAFPILWLARVAPNGRLLTHVDVSRENGLFDYNDCGLFDPAGCGEFLTLFNQDLCSREVDPLRRAGRRGTTLRLVRGALLEETRFRDFLELNLYSHRASLEIHVPLDAQVQSLIDALRRPGQEPGGALPQARLPRGFWKDLARVTAAHRRLKDVDAVAKRLHVARGEVKRRLAVAGRLAKLGVKRRLGCSG